MAEPEVIALGQCCVHGGLFEFDPDRVPSVLVDPETGLPPDVNEAGQYREPTAEALARSRREPYCPACARGLNAEAARRSLPARFDETDTAAEVSRG